MRYDVYIFTWLTAGAIVPALYLREQPVNTGSCSSSLKNSSAFHRYFNEGYSASHIDISADTICLRGTTQWAQWDCNNFAHVFRGMVAPAYTMLKHYDMLHPCVRIKLDSRCGANAAKDLLGMVLENEVTLGSCNSTTDRIVDLDSTEYLSNGVSVSIGDYTCEHMPGKSSMSMHAAFMYSHGLDRGVVPRADRAISVLLNIRTASTAANSRDLLNWDEIGNRVQIALAKFGVNVLKTDIGTRTVVEQAILAASTDFLIMHHGAANNHRYWLGPDSVLVETQPPKSWFCGHSFGHDDINYILSTDHNQTAGECGDIPGEEYDATARLEDGEEIDECNSKDCLMYSKPRGTFAHRKDISRKADPNRLISMLTWVLDDYEKDKRTFRRSLESLRLAQGWLNVACRGSALQLVEK